MRNATTAVETYLPLASRLLSALMEFGERVMTICEQGGFWE